MTAIFLDTALLAVPNYAIDDRTAQELIDRVIHFSELAGPDVPIDLVLSAEAENTLWANSLGPDYDQIEQFLELMNLSHIYSASDLLQRYHILLAQCLRGGSEYAEVRGLKMFETIPDLPKVAPASLLEESRRIFASASSSGQLGKLIRVGSAFFGLDADLFGVRAIVDDIMGDEIAGLGATPIHLDAEIQTLNSISDLIDPGIADAIWRRATTAIDLHFAVTLGALSILRDAGETPAVARLKPFVIGTGFYDSLNEVECLGSGRFAAVARDLCSQIIAGKCNRSINPFSLKGQYIRDFDKAKAWRTHVTNSGVGLRLMHWQNDQYIEFANIDGKAAETITQGSKVPAAGGNLSELL
jgi:hypothetical protein